MLIRLCGDEDEKTAPTQVRLLGGSREFRDTITNCLGEFREIKERTGITAYGHWQARLERLALSASGRERTVQRR